MLLLREIEHNQRLWHWANTEDAKDENTKPDPITLPGEEEAREVREEIEMRNMRHVSAVFGIEI